jgi:hypothetical protein
MECQHCHKRYLNKNNLTTHQKTARFCLKIQGKSFERNFICNLCNKSFANRRDHLQHYNNCSTLPPVIHLLDQIGKLEASIKVMAENHSNMTKEMEEDFSSKIEHKDKQILTYEVELQYKRDETIKLNREINRLNKRFDNILSKPSTIVQHHHNDNSTTNITFGPINIDTCKGYQGFLTDKHIEEGAIGVAKYALEFPLKNGYQVMDVDRKIVKYNNGQEIVETSIEPLRQIICESISDKQCELRRNHASSEYAKIRNGTATTEQVLERVINYGETCDAISKSASTGDSDKTEFDHELENNLMSYQI